MANKRLTMGKIVDMYIGNNVSTVTLMVKENKRTFFPSFKFIKTKAKEPSKFKIGDFVTIDSSVRSYAKKDENIGHRFIQYSRGKTITHTNNDVAKAFGFDVKSSDIVYSDSFELLGIVKRSNTQKGFANLLIMPRFDSVCVWVKVRSDKPFDIINKYKIGDTVKVIGHVETYKRKGEKFNKEQYMADFVYTDAI